MQLLLLALCAAALRTRGALRARGGAVELRESFHALNATANGTNGTANGTALNGTAPPPPGALMNASNVTVANSTPMSRPCAGCPSDAAKEADAQARQAYAVAAEAAKMAAEAQRLLAAKKAAGIVPTVPPTPDEVVLKAVKDIARQVHDFEHTARHSSEQRRETLSDRVHMPVVPTGS